MPTIKISEKNKQKLDTFLARKIGLRKDPSTTMDELISDLIECFEEA